MQSKKTFLPLLLSLLLFLPLLEQARHGYRHAEEVQCNEKAVHVCAKEHTCRLCDFVFSSQPSVAPEASTFAPHDFVVSGCLLYQAKAGSDKAPGCLCLRGPPAA